jgi:hypothetical protein
MIGDTPVQFIPTATELEKEAVENAISVKYKLIKLLEQAKIDKNLLQDVLHRYDLDRKFGDFMGRYYG